MKRIGFLPIVGHSNLNLWRSLLVACCLVLQATFTSERLLAIPFSSSLVSAKNSEVFPRNLPYFSPGMNSRLLAKSISCPTDLETLTALLLRDLPSYANRVIQQSRRLNRTATSSTYVLLAGRPEFEPLTLGPGEYTSPNAGADPEPPQQMFFTTLERQYLSGKASEIQLYHWLFLTRTSDGWRLAIMFSQIGSSAPNRPPTPPRESSKGIVGQAVSRWLRDCRAGAIRAPRERNGEGKTRSLRDREMGER
jgi:hypothetical protein